VLDEVEKLFLAKEIKIRDQAEARKAIRSRSSLVT
jgi:hypothetical protein